MANDWVDEGWSAPWGEEGESPDWADEQHTAWLDKWAPHCPMRNPQRLCKCLAYREREPGRLQLRVSRLPSTEGICAAIVDEDEDNVYVRVILCYEGPPGKDDEYVNCPVHVYLEKPLNGRTVIEIDTDRVLPLFVASWERS
jgi:hypothetical protein